MIVAGTALIVALVGTAMAAPSAIKTVLDKSEKKQVKSIAKNQVNNLAPGLSVANAGSLDHIDSSGFVQVKPRVLEATDTSLDNNYASDANLLQISNLPQGQYVVIGRVEIDSDDPAAEIVANCDLVLNNGALNVEDSESQRHGIDTHAADTLGYTLVAVVNAGAAGTDDVFIRCNDVGGTFDADNEQLVATLVNN